MERAQIERAVRRVRARLIKQFFVKWLTVGLAISVFAGSLLLLVSRWIIVPHYRLWSLAIVLGLFFVVLLAAWLKRPTWKDAVQYIDEPTENRVSTALKYAEERSIMASLQRQETVQVANQFVVKLRERLPFTWPRRWGLTFICFLCLFVALWLVPNPADEVLAKQKLEEQWITEQTEKIAELLHERSAQLKQEEALPEVAEAQESINAELEALLQQLEQLDRTPDALEQLADAIEALNEAMRQMEKETVKAEQALASSEEGSSEEASARELSEQLSELERDVHELARQLAEMGLPAARELAEQGQPVSSVWREGGLADASLQQGLNNGSDGQDSAGDSSDSNATNDSSGTGSDNGAQTGGDGSNGAQSAEGEGAGTGQGQGSSGQGSIGQGNAGSGQGQGQGSGSGQSPGSGQGSGGLQGGTGAGNRNMVSTPRVFAGESEPEVDGGPVRGEGGEMEHTGRGRAEAGTATPYEQVYGTYEQEARQSIERSPVPDRLKEIVKDYFTTISPSP